MRQLLVMIIPALVLAASCAAQNTVPPPDCLSAGAKINGSKRALSGATSDCAPGPITGLGTPGALPVFSTAAMLADSVIRQSASGGIGVGTANTGTARLSVAGNIAATGSINISGSATAANVSAGTVTATGALTANTVASTGSITGTDITATGAMKAATVAATGSITGSSFSAAGNINAANLTATGNISTALGNVTAFQYNIGPERMVSASGTGNTFTGVGAGRSNGGANNSYFGSNAGQFGFAGTGNSAFGADAGLQNGFNENSFFGHAAGRDFSGGNDNTLIGAHTQATSGIQNATAIGSKATVTQSNTLVLGGVSGVNSGSNVNVGIGTTEPPSRLTVANGDIYVSTAGTGLIVKTTNPFICGRLVVSGQGQVSATLINCPGATGF